MKGLVEVYCGDGKGKTSCAFGQCIKAAGRSEQVIVIQFLKGKGDESSDMIRRLEPEIQLFRFEKYDEMYMDLTDEQKKEQDHLIYNGLKYAKNVIDTRQCDFLVLDEVLGLLDLGLIDVDSLISLLEGRDEELNVILTGRSIPKELISVVDSVYEIHTIK